MSDFYETLRSGVLLCSRIVLIPQRPYLSLVALNASFSIIFRRACRIISSLRLCNTFWRSSFVAVAVLFTVCASASSFPFPLSELAILDCRLYLVMRSGSAGFGFEKRPVDRVPDDGEVIWGNTGWKDGGA